MTTTTCLADNVLGNVLELTYQLFSKNLEYKLEYEIDSKNEELTVKIFSSTSGYGHQIGQIEQTTNGYAAYDAVWGWTEYHKEIKEVITEMQMKMVCMTQLY